MNLKDYLFIQPEIEAAVKAGKPVVALESTILSHGMPWPENLEFAHKVQQVVRAGGAVPATTAIIDGSDPEDIYRLLDGEEIGTVFLAHREDQA